MKKLFTLTLLLSFAFALQAQNQLLNDMPELPDPKPGDTQAWSALVESGQTRLSWGNTDTRYSKTTLPEQKVVRSLKLSAWRGERVNAQAVLWTGKALQNAKVTVSDLKAGRNVILANQISAEFERYVLADGLNGHTGCFGAGHPFSDRDSVLVADIIATPTMPQIEAATVRPLWVTVRVPQSVPAATYRGTVTVEADNQKPLTLKLAVAVKNRVLPPAKEWSFHLDFWQNPFSVARYYNLQPWSDEHLEKMRPLMNLLANAGQKVITTTLIHDSWGDQTYDLFGTMILVTKKLDGTLVYNYDIFDRWVNFMMSCGINKQINCYTVVPWKEGYRYFDEASDSHQIYYCKVGDDRYKNYWIPFLRDFAQHLRAKGWFEKTHIAMDERTPELMQMAFKMIATADPEFKVAMAGDYHDEIQANLSDYCVPFRMEYPKEVLAERKARGLVTTYYTCCGEELPNTFTFSPLAEATFIPWVAAARGLDGYLRWAYNSWSKEPLMDARWFNFSSGDCWFVYPQCRSTMRLERFIEGVQDYEKIRILREEYARKGKSNALKPLDDVLKLFEAETLYEKGATQIVNKARAVLNRY